MNSINSMKDNQKKFTWSKGQLVVTGSLFAISLLFIFFIYITNRIGDAFDTAALVSCITVTGAIFGSNLVWYSKKAASENHYKLRISLYKDAAAIRLRYNESMMILMKKYHMTQEDIDNINANGDIDEMMDSSLQSTVSDLDSTEEDADSKNELEQFNM